MAKHKAPTLPPMYREQPREYCGKPSRAYFDPSKQCAPVEPKRHADVTGDAATNTGGMRPQGENK